MTDRDQLKTEIEKKLNYLIELNHRNAEYKRCIRMRELMSIYSETRKLIRELDSDDRFYYINRLNKLALQI